VRKECDVVRAALSQVFSLGAFGNEMVNTFAFPTSDREFGQMEKPGEGRSDKATQLV
jgi:hypothetical protein